MKPSLLIASIRELPSDVNGLAAHLGNARRRDVRRYRFHDDKLRSLAAGLLIDTVTAGREVLSGDFGKPYVKRGPQFNISHSGDYVVLAVARERVGVDIEFRREDDYARLAEVSFHPVERRLLAENYGCDFFYDMWVLKESYMEMTGKGFSLAPTSFRLVPRSASGAMAAPEDGRAVFRLYDNVPGYSLAVCVDGGELPEEPVRIRF